jgi:hypothetical protein
LFAGATSANLVNLEGMGPDSKALRPVLPGPKEWAMRKVDVWNNWAAGILTGALVLPLCVTTYLVCTGNGAFLLYEAYALPSLALEGAALGMLVSPLVLVLLGRTKATVAASALLAAVTGAAIPAGVIELMNILAWADGSLVERGDLLMPVLCGATVGLAAGGVVAIRAVRHLGDPSMSEA